MTWEPGRLPAAGNIKSGATSRDAHGHDEGRHGPLRRHDQPVRAAIESGSVPADRAEFDAPVGRVQLDMTIFGERGEKLDIDARDLEVPNLKGPSPLLLLPPVVLATRSAREFRDITADENAVPPPFANSAERRRLLIRIPAYASAGDDPRVTAKLLNRIGQLVHEIQPVPAAR